MPPVILRKAGFLGLRAGALGRVGSGPCLGYTAELAGPDGEGMGNRVLMLTACVSLLRGYESKTSWASPSQDSIWEHEPLGLD